METLLQTAVRHSRIALIGAGLLGAFAASAPTGASAQVYNPEDGEEFVQDVVVSLEGGERVNNTDEDGSESRIGTIGVQQCQNLEGRDGGVTFNFDLNTESFRGEIELEDGDDAYLMEFGAEDGPGECNREDTTECRRLDEELNNITITESQDSITVDINFQRLRKYVDKQIERCIFPTTDVNSLRTLDQGLHNDAGMHADAGVTGLDTGTDQTMDTGTGQTMDTGVTDTALGDTGAGGQDTGGGTTTPAGADRVYVVRLFLEGRRQNPTTGVVERTQVLADAALVLDRTRPEGVTNLKAAASENQLRVQFDPPEAVDEVDNYHAFFSNQPISGQTPEELEADANVTRRLLKGVSEQDDGTRTGRVDELSQTADQQLYVAVATRDSAENFSRLARTDSAVTVQKSTDFWDKYKSAGGGETGGCGCRSTTAAPAGSALMAALGLLVLGWRRRDR